FIEFGGWEMPLQYTGIVEEHVTVRKAVGLFDVSHMGKIFVEGSASRAFLHRLSANEISSTPARARYTHLLRDDGTIIDDVIVTCLAPDRFFLVCNAGPRVGVVSWLKNHMTEGVRLADRTLEFLCLAVQGPRAPELLQRFTSVDLSRLKPFSGAVLDFVPPAPWGAAPRAVPPEIEGWGRTHATDPSMPHAREPTVSDGRTAFLATRRAAVAGRLPEACRHPHGGSRNPATRASDPPAGSGSRAGDEWYDVSLPSSGDRARFREQGGLRHRDYVGCRHPRDLASGARREAPLPVRPRPSMGAGSPSYLRTLIRNVSVR